MVIGNGLLATTLMQYKDNDSILIFASGVSNSSCTDIKEFQREETLITKHLQTKNKFIYFSTISVYDEELNSSMYIAHKRKIEDLICRKAKSYIIFRLPILLGKSKNTNTLCNYIANRININQPINIYTQACRYLIDVEDLSTLLPNFIDTDSYNNNIIDINYNNKISIDELVNYFEISLKKTTKKTYEHKGGCYNTNNNTFIELLNSLDFIYDSNYLANRINKYYSNEH